MSCPLCTVLLPPCAPLRAAWIARQEATGQEPCSPLTGAPLAHTGLVPNLMARTLTAALADQGLLSDSL